jgi:hypothetical protein
MIEGRFRVAISGGALVAVLSTGSLAYAHGESDREPTVRTPAASEETTEGGEAETPFTVGIDYVFGIGKTVAADQLLPTSASVNPVNQVDSDPVQTSSFVFAFGYEPIKNLAFGVRVPLTVGSLSPDGFQSRTVSEMGNIELEAELRTPLSKTMALVYSLGFALPTAQGTRIPDTTAELAKTTFNQGSFDNYSIAYAAAGSRGYEENALFLPDRLGIIPKVALEYHATGGLRLDPYVKVENLASIANDGSTKYIGELVLGVRAGYLVNKYVEPGVRLWTTLAFAGDSDGSVAVVEPEAQFHIGVLTPYLGVIVPFAGPLAKDPSQFVGVRLGASLMF